MNLSQSYSTDLIAADEFHLHSQEDDTVTIETVVFPVIGVLLMCVFASLLVLRPCRGSNKSNGGTTKTDQKGQRLRFYDVTEQIVQPAIAPVLQQENNDVVDAVKKEYNNLPQYQPVSSLVAGISGLSCQTCAVNFSVSPHVVNRSVNSTTSPQTRQSDQENNDCATLSGTENVPDFKESKKESQMIDDFLEQSSCHTQKLSQQSQEKIQESRINTETKEIVDSNDTRQLTTPTRYDSHSQLSDEIDSLDYESHSTNSRSLLLDSRTLSPAALTCEPTKKNNPSQRILGLENISDQQNISTLSSRNLAVRKWLKDIGEFQSKEIRRENCVADQIIPAVIQSKNIKQGSRRGLHVFHRKGKLPKKQISFSLDTTSESDTDRLRSKLKVVDRTSCSHGLKCQSGCKKIVKRRHTNVKIFSTDSSFDNEREEKDTSQSCCKIKSTHRTSKRGRRFRIFGRTGNTKYDPFVNRKSEKTKYPQTCTNVSNRISSDTRGASMLGESGVIETSDVHENFRGASILAESQLDINNTKGQSSVQWKTSQTRTGSQNNLANELRDEISSVQRNGQKGKTENYKLPVASFLTPYKTRKSESSFATKGASCFGHQTKSVASNISNDNQTINWNNISVRDDRINTSSVSLSMAFDSDFSRQDKYNEFKSEVLLHPYKNISMTKELECCKQHQDESIMFKEMPIVSSSPIPREKTNERNLTSLPRINEANYLAVHLTKDNSDSSERKEGDCRRSTKPGNQIDDGFQITNETSNEKVNTRSCEGAETVLLPNENNISSKFCKSMVERKLSSSPNETPQFEKQESNNEDDFSFNSQKTIENINKNNAQWKNHQTTEHFDYNERTEKRTGETIENHNDERLSTRCLNLGIPQLDFPRAVPSGNSKTHNEENAQEKEWKTREISDQNIIQDSAFYGPPQPRDEIQPSHNIISKKKEKVSDENHSGNRNDTKQGVKPSVNGLPFMLGLLKALRNESSSKKLKKDTLRTNDEESVRKPFKSSSLIERKPSINNIKQELRVEKKLGRVNTIVKNKSLREKMDNSDFREKQKIDEANNMFNKECRLGKLNFSLIYNLIDESHCLLYVSIHQLIDLNLKCIGSQQGVQIKFRILPKGSTWKYSKIIKEENTTLQFKDVFIVSGISPQDLIDSVIKFVVLRDNFSLGELVVPLAELYYRKKLKRTSDLTQPETNAKN